jgi:predicted nucleic acid-binding protein
MIVFDATMMLLLMRPNTNAPLDPSTGKPVEYAETRITYLVTELEKSKTRIIIPTPALSELLVKADGATVGLIERIQASSVFRIAPFDTLAAIEVAEMSRSSLALGNKRGEATGTWAKIKYDRQIIAIAKVNKATAIYTDDENLCAFAEKQHIKPVRLADLPLPPEMAQNELFHS